MLKELPNLKRAVEDDPCYPLYGELIRMLKEDMSVDQGVIEHVTNFRFNGFQQDRDHELAHILYGFAQLKIGKPLTNFKFEYNNNGISEYIVSLIQDAFRAAEKSPLSFDAMMETYKAHVKHSLGKTGELPFRIGAFRNGSGTYKLSEFFPLYANAAEQKPPRSYFEYLLDKRIKDQDGYDENIEIPSGMDDHFKIEDPNEYLSQIFECLTPVLEHISKQIYKNRDKRKYKNNPDHYALRNDTIKNLKMRDLWNLMPVTEHEPIFSFSRKHINAEIEMVL